MSTTDGAIDQKLIYDLERTTENSYANETPAISKILFITFSTNQTT